MDIFESIVSCDKCAVVVCDLDHKIIYMNEAADIRYQKWGGKVLLGSSLLDCHNAESRKKIIEVVEWFKMSKDNDIVFTGHNDKENKDVYMVALRDENKNIIAYYEKHEYRDKETSIPYSQMK